jgi:hypothetical protein
MADLGRQSAAINMPVDQMDAFAKAVERAGGIGHTARSQLQSLADFMAEAKMNGGDPTKLGKFAAIGADAWRDSPLQVMMKAAEYAKTHDLLTAKTQLGALGLGDDAMLNLLKGGASNLQKEMEESRKNGVLSKEMTENAIELQKAFIGFGQALGFAKDAWVDGFSKPATEMLNWSRDMVRENHPLVEGIFNISLALAALGTISSLGMLFRLFSLLRGGAVVVGAEAATGAGGAGLVLPLALGGAVAAGAYGAAKTGEDVARHAEQGQIATSFDEFGNPLGYRDATPSELGRGGKPSAAPSPSSGNSPARGGQQGTRQETVDYFIAHGWTPAQAAAIADVFREESGYKASAYNSSGGGRGARGGVQWRGSRIEAFRKMFGHDPNEGTYAESLAFAQWELTQGDEKKSGSLLRGTNDERVGLALLNKHYTRPGHRYGNMNAEGSGNSTHVAINNINVHTSATDAAGIATSIKGAVNHAFISQANTGYA